MSSELRPNLVALNTIIYREVRRFMRIWPQTLLPPAITMVLYFVIFGNLIGRQIGDMGGFTYMEYIVPGLIILCSLVVVVLDSINSIHRDYAKMLAYIEWGFTFVFAEIGRASCRERV